MKTKEELKKLASKVVGVLMVLAMIGITYANFSVDEKAKVDALRAEMFEAYDVRDLAIQDAQAKENEVNEAKLDLPQRYCLEDPTYCSVFYQPPLSQ